MACALPARRPGTRLRARLACVLAAALLSTGCIGLPTDGASRLTAQQAVEEARTAAGEAWGPQAALVQVSTQGDPAMAPGDGLGVDGRSGLWWVTFWDEARGTGGTVLVHGDGAVATANTSETPPHRAPLPQGWAVGSAQAVDIARHDARFEQAVTPQDSQLALDLWDQGAGPSWSVLAWSHERNVTRLLHVDAATGEATAAPPS